MLKHVSEKKIVFKSSARLEFIYMAYRTRISLLFFPSLVVKFSIHWSSFLGNLYGE